MKNNLVAIVGRPNVGKSTLFNRLVGKRISIVHHEHGVTRDRLYQKVSWLDKEFQLIDTGGIESSNWGFQEQIKEQVKVAIDEASLILFVIDGQLGFTLEDKWVLSSLRKSNKKIMLVVNKMENSKLLDSSVYTTGVEDYFLVSAMHNQNLGNLLDKVISCLVISQNKGQQATKLSIIGKPNVGKSSLLNALTNDNRAIVSKTSGTTRDSVNAFIRVEKEEFEIIDTAGIRQKSKLQESVEHYALARALNSLENSDITLLVLDASQDFDHFGSRVAGYAAEHHKPIIIVVNKWDLVEKNPYTQVEYERNVRKHFKFLAWAPVAFVSALQRQRLPKLLKTVTMVKDNMHKKISTHLLNSFISEVQLIKPSNPYRGGSLVITFAKQVEDSSIPLFLFFVNNPAFLHVNYERFIQNKIREYFGFEGTPIRIRWRSKNGKK